ncbi:MAG: hypothetical protein ABGZ35_20220 [Planctomycetaceae bacterium]|jgi:hypothetical protein
MMETRNAQKRFERDFTQPIRQGPIERGLDEFFGVDRPNQPPFTWIEQDRVSIQPSDRYVHDPSVGVMVPKGCVGCPMAPNWRFDEILPEITRHAVRRIHELAREDNPSCLTGIFISPALKPPSEAQISTNRFNADLSWRSNVWTIETHLLSRAGLDRCRKSLHMFVVMNNTLSVAPMAQKLFG